MKLEERRLEGRTKLEERQLEGKNEA